MDYKSHYIKTYNKRTTDAYAHLHACFACFHACLHACLLASLHSAFMLASIDACVGLLRACLLGCLHALLLACLPACTHASMAACSLACLLACWLARLHACMPACMRACPRACLLDEFDFGFLRQPQQQDVNCPLCAFWDCVVLDSRTLSTRFNPYFRECKKDPRISKGFQKCFLRISII